MKKILGYFIVLVYLSSCGKKEKDVIGVYVSRNNINTIDTLEIKDDGNYVNSLYRFTDKSLVYKNNGRWEVSKGSIKFYKFYCDEDEIHSKEPINYESVLITSIYPIEKQNNKIVIHQMQMNNEIYFEKIK